MGQEVDQQEFSRADRTAHREKVRRCLDVFALMLRQVDFDAEDPMTGLEIEFNLVDDDGRPALKSAEALAAIANPDFQTELGQFNLEVNVAPRRLGTRGITGFEDDLRASLNAAEASASEVGAHLVMIGILPTLEAGHLGPATISPNPRYQLLSDQILNARGEDIAIAISGRERLQTTADSIMPEAACTSTQLHTQVSPEDFASYWNAAQAIAGIQLAVGANSPYLLGKDLWAETRIPLFEQATDTRSEELKAQGVLAAGPTVSDTIANAAFHFGLVRALVDDERPLWSQMSFSAAEENFHVAARDGIDAQVYWPGIGQVSAAELVLRRLLPLAREGLRQWGADPDEAGRLLGIIEARCSSGQNGASWFRDRVRAREATGVERREALRLTLLEYRERMHSNEPVHTWPVP